MKSKNYIHDLHTLSLLLLRQVVHTKGEKIPEHCISNDYTTIECYGFMPSFLPGSMRKVIIYEVTIHQGLDFEDPGWENITHLFINPGLSVFHNKWEPELLLYSNTFIKLKSLQHLQLACKSLAGFQTDAFKGLTELRVLDLSNNIQLKSDHFVVGFEGMDILPKLSELYLSNCSSESRFFLNLNEDFYEVMKDKPLKVFDISNCRIGRLAMGPKLLNAFQHLEKLNISGADMVLTQLPELFANIHIKENTSFTQLKVLDFSNPGLLTDWDTVVFKAGYSIDFSISFPSTLVELYANKITNTPRPINGISNSTHICLTRPSLNSTVHICFLAKFNKIKKISLAENSLKYFEPNMITSLKGLQYLDASKNKLGKAIASDNFEVSVMDILNNLEVLIKSENGIFYIPEETFRSSKFLRHLDLSKNDLETVTFRTDYLQSLERLDLSSNKIAFLDTLSMNKLTNLFAHISTAFNRSSYANNQIILTGNPFKCTCESAQFLKRLTVFNTTFTCEMDSRKVTIDKYSIKRAEYKCKETFVIIVFSIFASIVVVAIAVLVYFIIREKRRRKIQDGMNRGIENYALLRIRDRVPPVFLSFCSEDDDFVMEHIYPQLNDGLKKVLNTDTRCVAMGGMDFVPGFPLANEIIGCIEASIVVVLVVTNIFCRKQWCRLEAMQAHIENKRMVLMFPENVDVTQMPKHLYKHYMRYT